MIQTDSDSAWPSADKYRRSIKVEFALFLCGAFLLLMLVTGYITTNRFVTTVTERLVETLVVQARAHATLAGKHLISSDQPDAAMLSSLCTKLAVDNPDVLWAAVVGGDAMFIAHTEIKQVVTGRRGETSLPATKLRVLREGEGLRVDHDTLTVSIPIEEQGVRLGNLLVAISDKSIALARRNSIVSMATITAIMLLLGIPLTLVTISRRLKPFGTIIASLKNVAPQNPTIDIPVTGPNEFGYLADTLRAMGVRLVEAQQQLVEQQRMARDLEIAREIQLSILPKEYPSGVSFRFAGNYRSAKEVGGDYFDFIRLDDHRIGFLVADVSGKSLPGMLVMLMTRDIVLKHARSAIEPAEVLSLVNRELHDSIRKGMFVTMFYGLADSRNGTVTFASAGHNPLIFSDQATGAASLIKTKGFPLGMMGDDMFRKRIEQSQVTLRPGDLLLQYTDGVNEALDIDKREFGMDRLVENVRHMGGHKPEELVDALLANHSAFVGGAEQYDDITVLALKWIGPPADISTTEKEPVAYARIN